MSIINYLAENYVEILATLAAISYAATLVTALTPTPKDDAIVSKIRKVLEFISLRMKR